MKKQDAPIRIKRVYDPPDASDGTRVLVNRLWPRGLRRSERRADLLAEGNRAEPGSARVVRPPKLLDAAYPAHTAIKLILDNHSAHISKETKAWLAEQPTGRFEFTFTPKHGSWLNLVEGFFSKLARSVLRHIRVASKQELKDRIMAAMDEFRIAQTRTVSADFAPIRSEIGAPVTSIPAHRGTSPREGGRKTAPHPSISAVTCAATERARASRS